MPNSGFSTAPDLNIVEIQSASRETLAQQVALLQQERLRSNRVVQAATVWAAAWDDLMTQGEDAGPEFTAAADALLDAVRPGGHDHD